MQCYKFVLSNIKNYTFVMWLFPHFFIWSTFCTCLLNCTQSFNDLRYSAILNLLSTIKDTNITMLNFEENCRMCQFSKKYMKRLSITGLCLPPFIYCQLIKYQLYCTWFPVCTECDTNFQRVTELPDQLKKTFDSEEIMGQKIALRYKMFSAVGLTALLRAMPL